MKTAIFAITLTAAALMVSATVWEGAAAVSPEEIPEIGAAISTNAFPKNTVVYVTNLENNKSVGAIVVSSLDSSGLLATLSERAAVAIGIKADSVGRIRLILPEDAIAFSRYRDGMEEISFSVETEGSSEGLSLIPSEDRVPEGSSLYIIPSTDYIPSIETTVNEYVYIAGIPENGSAASPAEREYVPPADFSPFQVPLISSLEQGKWYIQVGAYTRSDYVEDEINRIGTGYPLLIQNVGTDIKPMFRILLGPMNQGESGAMLQRVKSIGYSDAFARHN